MNFGPYLLARSLFSSTMALTRSSIRLVRTTSSDALSIFEQLCIEEALLRSDSRNWCILNRGANPPVIVMGISGKPEMLVQLDAVKNARVPVIRRFSGGGTVVVDSGTVFASFVCSRDAVPEKPSFPRELMEWSAKFYEPVFSRLCGNTSPFSLRENDYCLGDTKVGGNAQTLSAGRWVHHTSFLWSFREEHMRLLTLPSKRPAYRLDRPHSAFLTPLCEHHPFGGSLDDSEGAEALHDAIEGRLHEAFDVVETATLAEVRNILAGTTQRQTNEVVQLK